MFDTHALLEKQSKWQRTRAQISWGEKIRQAEQVRSSIKSLAGTGQKVPKTKYQQG